MDRNVTHATFTLERTYPHSLPAVFAAWADPSLKAQWFAPGSGDHELDFRVDGRESVSAEHDGKQLRFDTVYRDIVDGERIAYSSVMTSDGRPTTLSQTTVEFRAVDGGTAVVLTEQGAFLDGMELPEWREEGTASQLEAIDAVLAGRGA
ncbi:MAG TPA: SRPBCC domain-containing protein [Acidimicrobiales bacterium]|nr:SRPBCC domain-containing protein [Acidimicrobiales bacterium]